MADGRDADANEPSGGAEFSPRHAVFGVSWT
jgi:hypothetical protein